MPRKTVKKRATKNDSAPEQKYIEGTEPKRIRKIDNLALKYAEKRDARQAILKEEVELKEKLLAAMHDHDLTCYPIPDTTMQVEVVPEGETVKVGKRKKPKKEKQAA